LGLSIVEAIADAHGARLRAVPRAEGGLRVEVSFPAFVVGYLTNGSRATASSNL
jgi:signal transduction histidine kinase